MGIITFDPIILECQLFLRYMYVSMHVLNNILSCSSAKTKIVEEQSDKYRVSVERTARV